MDFIEPCFGIGHNLSLICQMTSEDIKHQLIIIITSIPPPPFSPSLISLMVSVDVKHHVYLLLLKQIVFGFVFCLILFYAFVCLFFCLRSLVSINFSCRLKRCSSVLLSVCTHARAHKHTQTHTEPLWGLGVGLVGASLRWE